jgi:putative hemolysin
MPFELLVILALILLNGFFALSELAVMTARRPRLRRMAESSRGARTALELAEAPERFLSSVQVWITLLGILTGFFGGEALSNAIEPSIARITPVAGFAPEIASAIALALILYVSVVLGELVPKRLAIVSPEAIASRVAIPMRLLASAASPAVTLLARSTELILAPFRIGSRGADQVSEEEIRHVLAEGAESGAIDRHERDMVNRVLALGERSVASLMLPRSGIVWLDADAALDENLSIMRAAPYSRYPVKRRDEHDVVGILQVKSLAEALAHGRPDDLFQHLAPAVFVPESAPALSLLARFRDAEAPLALVVDEFGDIVGMVTPNNLLSAIFGRLAHSVAPDDAPLVQRNDGSWLVDGRVPVEDLKETLGLARLPREDTHDYHTAAGMLIAQFGRIPGVGEGFDFGRWHFEVVDLDGARVDKLLVSPLAAKDSTIPADGGE